MGRWMWKLRRRLHRLFGWVVMHIGFISLAAGCLLWSALALPFVHLPLRYTRQAGRTAAMRGFRLYLWWLHVIGVLRCDLRALDALRGAGPMIIAPNHPSLLDAVMVISRLPNVACVLKATLLDNPLWGAGARVAGYVRNDWFIGSINLAVAELRRGGQLLLFPEGTRTECPPFPNPFRAGTAYIAHRAAVPIQTVFIEHDSRFLGKGWPLFGTPRVPVHYRVRLGERFDPPEDPVAFTQQLHDYFAQEMRTDRCFKD